MLRSISLMAVVSGCSSGAGVSPSTLQGAGSFVPNAVLAEQVRLRDGGMLQGFAEINIENTTPAESCAFIDAGPPDSGLIFTGFVQLLVASNTPIQNGSYEIVAESAFVEEENHPDGGIASVELFQPTDPPSGMVLGTESSLSGNLKLTSVGNEWAGSFSTVLQLFDGGQAQLSGTFDTTSNCVVTQ